MLKIKKFVSLVIVGIFSLSLFFATGCAWHPSTEEISKMEEARKACLAAEKKLSDTQKEREALESEVAQKKANLADAQKEKELIEQRANNWTTEE